jgi:hypothetical protein
MEVGAKGGGWEGGRWVGVGRSFPKNNLGSGVGPKKSDKKNCSQKKKHKIY